MKPFPASIPQFVDNKNSLLGAIRRLKPAVLRSSLNREFLELKTVGLKSGVLNPPVFNKIKQKSKKHKLYKQFLFSNFSTIQQHLTILN